MGKRLGRYHYIYEGEEALLIAGVLLVFFFLGVWVGVGIL